MTTSIEPPKTPPSAATAPSTFRDALRALVGKRVTVVTSESYEKAPVGHHLRPAFYPSKVASIGQDYVVLLSDGQKNGMAKQLVPLASIKRVSLMKGEVALHL